MRQPVFCWAVTETAASRTARIAQGTREASMVRMVQNCVRSKKGVWKACSRMRGMCQALKAARRGWTMEERGKQEGRFFKLRLTATAKRVFSTFST
jgi:hypothetical protein